jgi:predicted DNA-binding transcriptional regulator YafY
MVELAFGQRDPSRIEGLIIDFRYVAADHEVTHRSLLCWQCGRVGERIYVRGYCPFREELRTFRVDRMHDVIAFRDGRQVSVDRVHEFFAAFAADEMNEDEEPPRLASRGG